MHQQIVFVTLLEAVIIGLHGVIQIAEPEGYGKKGGNKRVKAAFADGTALPAKRPRTSNTTDPDAARSNKRIPAITDFFNSIVSQAADKKVASDTSGLQALTGARNERQVEQSKQSKEEPGVYGPQPSSAANGTADIANAERHKDQSAVVQGDQQQRLPRPAKDAAPSAERKRQIMADAATHRLASQQRDIVGSDARPAGSGCLPTFLPGPTGHYGTKQEGTSQAVYHARAHDSLDTTSVADKGHVSAVIDLVNDDQDVLEVQQSAQPKSMSVLHSSQQSPCPICGQQWSRQTSNAELNEHIDKCLSLQLL